MLQKLFVLFMVFNTHLSAYLYFNGLWSCKTVYLHRSTVHIIVIHKFYIVLIVIILLYEYVISGIL